MTFLKLLLGYGFAALGGKRLIISNAAGAVNLNFDKGELMLLTDHLNLQEGLPWP